MDHQTIERIEQAISAEFARSASKSHPVDFPGLPDLPAGRYTDPAFYAQEQATIWSKSWLFAGHADELPEVGSYKLWRDSGVPVILVRGQDRVIRGFYNTCRHRGGPLVREACGKVRSLLCQYHSWNYDLTGKLLYVPDAHEFPALELDLRGLIPVRVEMLGNWIFANSDIDAEPLAEAFGPLKTELEHFHPERLRLVDKHSFEVKCNWKVFMDAFQEVYHVKHIHRDSVDMLIDYRGTVMTLFPHGHSRMIVPAKSDAPAMPTLDGTGQARQPEAAHRITNNSSRSYNAFPNIVTPTAEFEFPFLVFWPTSIRSSRLDVWWFGQADNCDPKSDYWIPRLAGFDRILKEDMENLAFIQESLESPGFTGVPLGYSERRIYAHHEQVDRTIGVENVPAGLAIPQILEPFVEA